MPVHEWSVLVTDWLLAALCIILAHRLRRRTPIQRRSPRLVATAFDVCAVCAFIGGIRHGLGPWLPPPVYRGVWYIGYVFVLLAGTFLLLGVLRSLVRSSEDRSLYTTLAWFVGGLGSLFLFFSGSTLWVALAWGTDTVVIGMMALYAIQQWATRNVGKWLLAGALISILAGLVQQGLLVGAHGTLHDDLFHLIQMPAIWCYFQAALLFRETPDSPAGKRLVRWTRAVRRPFKGSDDAA